MKTLDLLYTSRPLVINPELAFDIGLNEAIVLQQIHYWLQRSNNIRDDQTWVYKTYDEWALEFPFWSTATIRRAIRKLETLGLVKSSQDYNRMKMDKTKWYTIPEERVSRPCDQIEQTEPLKMSRPTTQDEQTEPLKMSRPITKDYTETTNRDYKHLPTLDDTPVQPNPPEQQVGRSTGPPTPVGLLTDSFVGLQLDQARKYQRIDPELVARHVFEWERDMRSGKVNSVGALVARLNKADSWRVPELSHDDRSHPYYVRHFGQYDFRAAESRENRDYMLASTITEDASRMEYAI